MPIFWFIAGVVTTLATLVVILPWLRRKPRLSALPALPWQASVGALVIAVATLGSYRWLGPDAVSPSGALATTPALAANSVSGTSASAFGDAAKVFASATVSGSPVNAGSASPGGKSAAGSMNTAIASLESRLAKGAGSADDWELLAKSFEFIGHPADAAKARSRQLPPIPMDAAADGVTAAPMASAGPMGSAPMIAAAPAATRSLATAGASTVSSAPAASGSAVSGEISLAPGLKTKAAAGETLFIVAKSVDTPGIPVAVFRGSVGSWPLKFTLDDSQSMLPGRNLSSAGRVTIEARISQKGQPLPAAGDLQGSTGVINPTDHQPLKILIDHVIT